MKFDKRDAMEPEVRRKLALKLRVAPCKRARAGVGHVQNAPFPGGLAPVPQRRVSHTGPGRMGRVGIAAGRHCLPANRPATPYRPRSEPAEVKAGHGRKKS